jgi:hypothetical protein
MIKMSKKLLFASALIGLTATIGIAQSDTHSLKILKDDPNAVSNHIVAINGSHGHFSKNEGLKAGIGTEVLWGLNSRMQIQNTMMLYYLNIKNAPGIDFNMEGGVAYTVSSRSRTAPVKIILSHTESKSETSTTVTTTSEIKYLVSSATFLSTTRVRTGLMCKQSGMVVGDEALAPVTNYFGVGVYGGLEFTKQACLFSEVDGKNGVTSGYTRFYIDGMFMPVSKYQGAVTENPGKLGARFGFATYFNPNKRKNPEFGTEKLKNYQVYPSLFFKSEAGIRGGEGWFFNLGLGFMIHRNK